MSFFKRPLLASVFEVPRGFLHFTSDTEHSNQRERIHERLMNALALIRVLCTRYEVQESEQDAQ